MQGWVIISRMLRMSQWIGVCFAVGLLFLTGCSTLQQSAANDPFSDSGDPFDDPFFTDPPAWDASLLQHSEPLTQDGEEPTESPSLLEKSEGVVMSTFMVGASIAKIVALPLLGGL